MRRSSCGSPLLAESSLSMPNRPPEKTVAFSCWNIRLSSMSSCFKAICPAKSLSGAAAWAASPPSAAGASASAAVTTLPKVRSSVGVSFSLAMNLPKTESSSSRKLSRSLPLPSPSGRVTFEGCAGCTSGDRSAPSGLFTSSTAVAGAEIRKLSGIKTLLM